MPDKFSIPDLLSLLQVDRQNAAIRMAVESERLCRRQRYEDSITVANNAVLIAGHKSELQGVALLYLSTARFATAMPDERQKSIRDCTRAIRALAVHSHNRAIAQIVRAKFELESDGMHNKVSAMKHLNDATKTLQALIADSYEHQRLNETKLYQDLLVFVKDKTEQLHSSLTEIELSDRTLPTQPIPASSIPVEQPVVKPTQPQEVPPQQTASWSQREKIQGKLPVPTRLLWPTPAPTKVELFPIGNGARLDYIDASRLSIDGQPFSLEPVYPVSSHDKAVRLFAGQQYLAYHIDGSPNQRVLVRSQDRPDQVRQFVVVSDPTEPRVWIDDAESDPLFSNIHILGINRSWSTEDAPEVKPHIIGIVEALMTAVKLA